MIRRCAGQARRPKAEQDAEGAMTGKGRRLDMLVSDILRSCAHGHVAAAAIKSIGGDFAASVQRRAEIGRAHV